MNTLEIIGMQCIAGTASDMLFIVVANVIDCQHYGIKIIKSGITQSIKVCNICSILIAIGSL